MGLNSDAALVPSYNLFEITNKFANGMSDGMCNKRIYECNWKEAKKLYRVLVEHSVEHEVHMPGAGIS